MPVFLIDLETSDYLPSFSIIFLAFGREKARHRDDNLNSHVRDNLHKKDQVTYRVLISSIGDIDREKVKRDDGVETRID
ncbi:MAG TPA: hypothetical protein VKM55_09110 [Candidatus Lokiarchaeia archaeon]|nr:hypothetical protein [Candidatus Lokiarchaeia archaeon]